MLMSITIFAGSIEFVTVNMLLGAFNPLQAFVMTLMINARHLFYGISMLDKFRGTGWKKVYLIFGMCDESFSINYTADIPENVDRGWFMFFVTLLNHFYWFSGATLGGIFGSLIHFNTEGLDFVMTAMFVVIFMEQWLKEKNHTSSILGLGISLLCLIAFGADNFIIRGGKDGEGAPPVLAENAEAENPQHGIPAPVGVPGQGAAGDHRRQLRPQRQPPALAGGQRQQPAQQRPHHAGRLPEGGDAAVAQDERHVRENRCRQQTARVAGKAGGVREALRDKEAHDRRRQPSDKPQRPRARHGGEEDGGAVVDDHCGDGEELELVGVQAAAQGGGERALRLTELHRGYSFPAAPAVFPPAGCALIFFIHLRLLRRK